MSMQPRTDFAVPVGTAQVAQACFPKGNVYMSICAELGPLYQDSEFAPLFAIVGQRCEAPGKLVLVLIMQQAEGLSDRQAAEAVRSRIDWKYLLGLPLDDPGFEASVLSEFRQRLLCGGQEAQLLDDLLRQCQLRGWLKGGGKQRTDSTHVLAAVRVLNRLEMVGETLRQALEQLAVTIPGWLQVQAPAEWYRCYARRFEQYRLPAQKPAQTQLGERIGADGFWLWQALSNDQGVAWVLQLPALQVLRQVWLQQYDVDGETVRWRPPGQLPPASLLIESPYDPEARFGQKRELTWVGYRAHFTASCEEESPLLITQVQTTPAPTPDLLMTTPIQQDLVRRGLAPAEHLLDAGYVDAQTLVQSQQLGITIVGQVKADSSPQAHALAGFALTAFQIDWHNQTARCPQGNTSRIWSTEFDQGGIETIRIRFAKADCDACPLRSRCTSAGQGRTLRLRTKAQHEALQAARLAQTTPEFKAVYNARAGIEGTFSQAVNTFNLRRSRYVGQAKTHLQNLLIAIAINFVRIAAWVQAVPRAKTRTSRFAALAPT